jgi:transposase-like protein
MSIFDFTLATFTHQYCNEINVTEWQSFQEQFNSEEDAIAFLFRAKWPNGFRCPRCCHQHAYVISTRKLPLYQCHSCHHQTSLTAGTVMENSRTPMLKWLTAFFLISRTNSVVNAVQLQQRIHVTYKTSWTMLHVIRRAINEIDNKQPLTGTIRGGIGFCSQLPYSPTTKLQPQEKPVLIGATIDEHEKPVIFKMKLVDKKLMETKHLNYLPIREFTNTHIAAGTKGVQFVQRFAFNKYRSIKNIFDQVIIQQTRTFKGLTSRYLQLYLDEACFRINQFIQHKPIFENLSHLCMTTQRNLTTHINLIH